MGNPEVESHNATALPDPSATDAAINLFTATTGFSPWFDVVCLARE